jgi:hypothetical protein
MLKSVRNIIRHPFNRKQRYKFRRGTYWTDLYRSPEPSFLKRNATKTCDWVFFKIDGYFRGYPKQEKTFYSGSPDSKETYSAYIQEWELNQDVADIALKDLNYSLNWLIPDIIKHFANRLHQELLLYFYTDTILEDGSLNVHDMNNLSIQEASSDKSKIISMITELQAGISSKLLSISDWWLKMIHKLSQFLKMDHKEKTYYLLGTFASQGYDNHADNSIYMIRGPDKLKINPTFSFHKRN